MHEQDRLTRLAREKALYRYTLALERGDIETMADVLYKAEQDRVLEHMLFEVLEAFQQEDRTTLHADESQPMLVLLNRVFLLQDDVTLNMTQDEASRNDVALLPEHGQQRTKERTARTMNALTGTSSPFSSQVDSSSTSVTFWQRFSVYLQNGVTVLVVTALIVGFLVVLATHHMEPGGAGPPAGKVNGTWHLVPSPNPGTSQNILNSVTALSAKDAWAVGYLTDNNGNASQTLIEHWNGSQWSIVPSPNPGKSTNSLYGVAAVSANDVWAVGAYSDSVDGSTGAVLIEHWNGARWVALPGPISKANVSALYAVTALSTNNVWAVGIAATSSSPQAGQTLTEHWNGTRWNIVASPSVLTNDYLNSVVAISANDVWAVGISSPSNNPQGALTLTEHWNGTRWSIVKSPNPGSNDTLYSVVAASAHNVWALGYFENAHNNYETFVAHWDGMQWMVVKSPNVGSKVNVLNAAAIVSAHDIWAVGYASNSDANHAQTLIEHWDGRQWSVVKSPNPPAGGNDWLFGVATVPSVNAVWAVGFSASYGFNQAKTLIEHYS